MAHRDHKIFVARMKEKPPVPIAFCPTVSQPSNPARHNGTVQEPTRHTIIRRHDEPRLEIGATVQIKEGVFGVVLARYVRPTCWNEVHYVVELKPDEAPKQHP